MNKKIMAVSILIAVLFVSSIAGTAFYYNSYYNGIVNDRNSQIASLNAQIANQNNEISNLKNQISNLTAQVTNLTTAYLVTALGVAETPAYPTYEPYAHLFISGLVTDDGGRTAYNAGLHVIAHDATGTLEINMTVPLGDGTFGTDNATNAYVSSTYGSSAIGSAYGIRTSSLQLGSLDSGVTTANNINIFHEGVVSNWTVTPVWTNSP